MRLVKITGSNSEPFTETCLRYSPFALYLSPIIAAKLFAAEPARLCIVPAVERWMNSRKSIVKIVALHEYHELVRKTFN